MRDSRRRRDYLRDREDRRRDRERGRRDRERSRERDRERQDYYSMGDYDYDYERGRRGDSRRGRDRSYDEERYMEYEQPRKRMGIYDRGDMRRDYADEELEEEWEEDLQEWIKKLKKKDRFNMSKENVIAKAKEMRVDFKDYDEEEFYATYLMQVSDYPSISNDSRVYLSMAKSWLEDDDVAVEPSEKLCKYYYEIVKAED